MVISEITREIEKRLLDNARFEAELIVMNVLGINRTQLIMNADNEVTHEQLDKILSFSERRLSGEPLQYILGETEFMSLDFRVESGVLIPRSDTEILVETVIDAIKNTEKKRVADICTGTGCIGISVAHYNKEVSVDLIDVSDKAINTANQNIVLNSVSDRVKTIKMDILNECPMEKYDVVISNPPYIETEVIETLQTEVKNHEPHLALDGGADGLMFYRRIIKIAPQILSKDGILAFEIGYNQGFAVSKLMEENFKSVKVVKDLNKNDRVVIGIFI